LHDPGPLPEDPDKTNMGKGELRAMARDHALNNGWKFDKGWKSLDANIYAQGYIEGTEQLELSHSEAEGFATGYGIALDGFVQARLSGEHAPDESAIQAKESELHVQFSMKWTGQLDRIKAGMNGYKYANDKLRVSPPSAQAYAYGYARAFADHFLGMPASESPGEILRKKAERIVELLIA